MPENSVTRQGSSATVCLGGDLVASAVVETRGEWKQLLADGVTSLVVDLSLVQMVDSQGIGLFVAVYNSLQKAGGSVAIVNASKDIADLFTSMRLDHHFSISGPQTERGGR